MSATPDAIRVLHVDDDVEFAELAADFLEREDEHLSVETAASAEEGLDRIADGDAADDADAETNFDCIVSDYDMPEMDGIELLETVRETHPELPFILYTGKGSEDVASEAVSAGVTDYLQKESGTEQYALLANRIRNAVEGYRAKRAIEQSERQLRQVYERVTDGFFAVNTDWEYVYVNREGAKLTGHSVDDLVGETIWEAFPELVGSPFEDALRTAMESGETVAIEEYYPPHDSWYDVRIYGSEDGISIYFQDVTERKERERERERFETIIEASGDPVYTLDDEGALTYVNDALVELTGYDEEALLGEYPSKILPDEHVRRAEELIRSLLTSGENRETFEMDIITADGEEIHCETHLALLPFDEEFRGTVGVVRDITDRLERERQLTAERNRLDEFASVVSHDLRNPLNVAQGNLALAAEECDSDYLDTVADAHDRMESLIEDVLTLARAGESARETERLSLADVIEKCWRNVETASAELVSETERTVSADPSQLQQLLENLFRNAVEHGGDDVTVRVDDLEDGFYVADDGPGIPEGERENVFETGYSTAEGGTGFGLNIVERIASAHGWDVAVTASDAGGARFEITGVDGGIDGDT